MRRVRLARRKQASAHVNPLWRKGWSPTSAQDVEDALDSGSAVASRAALETAYGLPSVPKPAEEPPALPDDVTEMDNLEVSRLHSRFTLWQAYVRDELSHAESVLAEIDLLAHRVGAGIRRQTPGTAAAKADERDVNPQYALLATRRVYQSALVEGLRARHDRFERYANLMSRQITLRTQE